MADQDENRNEAATPFKLKEAQKRGQVAKSQEVVFVAVLAATVLVLYAQGDVLARRSLALVREALQQLGRDDWSANAVAGWVAALVGEGLLLLAPLLLAVAAAAVLANVAQTGPVFSAKPITPDFAKLNPAAGFKRLFSMRLLYEAFKSVLKLAVMGAVLWLAIGQLMPILLGLSYVDVRGHGFLVMGQIAPLLGKLLLIILVVASVDALYTRWDYAKKMRMSRREITDEHKQREGDPRIRSRLRQLRLEMLKQSRAVRGLPGADVLLTNPTHIAVAIAYRHGEMPAPQLVAKGAGEVAAKMRAVARRNGIPIVENRPLARALYQRVDFEAYVPEDLYPVLARILLWVYAMRQQHARSGVAS
jgi:flagellar biosynthetic protein FlhB